MIAIGQPRLTISFGWCALDMRQLTQNCEVQFARKSGSCLVGLSAER
jgi:hypothetical protein